ncbi:hypothetical protein FOZ63_019847, partial [Perkinsus olseni]
PVVDRDLRGVKRAKSRVATLLYFTFQTVVASFNASDARTVSAGTTTGDGSSGPTRMSIVKPLSRAAEGPRRGVISVNGLGDRSTLRGGEDGAVYRGNAESEDIPWR